MSGKDTLALRNQLDCEKAISFKILIVSSHGHVMIRNPAAKWAEAVKTNFSLFHHHQPNSMSVEATQVQEHRTLDLKVTGLKPAES